MSDTRRLWDWRFILSLTVMAAVGWMVVSGIMAGNELQVRDAQLKVRSGQITSLIAEVQQNNDAAAAERATGAHNQQLLLEYMTVLSARQSALLQYLNVNGIKIPVEFLTPAAPPASLKPLLTPKAAPTPAPAPASKANTPTPAPKAAAPHPKAPKPPRHSPSQK